MVGSAALKQGRSANRKHTYFFFAQYYCKQYGFVPGKATTDAIFVVRQLQEKYLAVNNPNKRLYTAFMDLEKAFDFVPQKVIWWALRKLGVEEWIVQLVQGMYASARSQRV